MSNEKVYIVYLTSGDYSDYQLNCTLLGNLDPIPILDSFVKQESNGFWKTYESMRKYEGICLEPCYIPNPWTKEQMAEGSKKQIIRGDILQKLPQVLKDNGFKEIEALELWSDLTNVSPSKRGRNHVACT